MNKAVLARIGKIEQSMGGDGYKEAEAVTCAWIHMKTGTATVAELALIAETPYADVLRHRRVCASRSKGGGPGLIDRLNDGIRRAREGHA